MVRKLSRNLTFAIYGMGAIISADKALAFCQNSRYEDLKKSPSYKNAENLIFFASWCLGCAPHIQNMDKKKDLVVVAFDGKESAEEALRHLGITDKTACAFDKDGSIAKHYNVLSLPKALKKKRSTGESK